MTIPNVTMRWCPKKSTCRWCEQPIEKGTPEVHVFYWNKGNKDSRKWNTTQFFHVVNEEGIHCWDEQGLDYLKRNPYVSRYKGRRPTLSEEDRRKRFLLVRRFNAITQRKRNNNNFPDNILMDIKLTQQMIDIMLETAIVGGVPKGWVEKFD